MLAQAQAAHPEVQFVFIDQGEGAVEVSAWMAQRGLAMRNVLVDPSKQAAKALELWTKAKAWQEHQQQHAHAVQFASTPPNQRDSVSNWETWYELDILWRELASRFEKKKT